MKIVAIIKEKTTNKEAVFKVDKLITPEALTAIQGKLKAMEMQCGSPSPCELSVQPVPARDEFGDIQTVLEDIDRRLEKVAKDKAVAHSQFVETLAQAYELPIE